MSQRPCPVCGASTSEASPFLEENVDETRLGPLSYASRKPPEFMNLRLVRCGVCDLIYADQPPSPEELAHSYHVAEYDSSEEANSAALAYIRGLRPALAQLSRRHAALEIGTGTAVFLEHLVGTGFETVIGVEPSRAAIEAAPAHRQSWIREGVFEEQEFKDNSFDLICCFMTLEHVADPATVVQTAYRLLAPGGALALVVHDHRSWVNRLLGRRSPIIDIEHMQLFSCDSVGTLLRKFSYSNIEIRSFKNRYQIRYWWRLSPLPNLIKVPVGWLLDRTPLGRVYLAANVGNLLAIGFRPISDFSPLNDPSTAFCA